MKLGNISCNINRHHRLNLSWATQKIFKKKYKAHMRHNRKNGKKRLIKEIKAKIHGTPRTHGRKREYGIKARRGGRKSERIIGMSS